MTRIVLLCRCYRTTAFSENEDSERRFDSTNFLMGYVCMCVCVHIYIYIYTYTHTHIRYAGYHIQGVIYQVFQAGRKPEEVQLPFSVPFFPVASGVYWQWMAGVYADEEPGAKDGQLRLDFEGLAAVELALGEQWSRSAEIWAPRGMIRTC